VASESEDILQESSETLSGHAPRFRPESVWLAALLASSAAVALGLVIYLVLHLVLLKGVAPNDVIRTTLTLMAGLAAVLTGLYAYRKQRLSEADGARADADQGRADADQARADEAQLSQRYSTAAEQLGHNKAAVRLAGAYAMARLADDWPNQRKQCIDVLCAYVRMPANLTPAGTDLSEREVRATIVRTIADHLRDQSAVSWSKHNFDFTGAAFHDADFVGATFSGENTRFDDATFSGRHSWFDGAKFTGRYTRFDGAKFTGRYTRFMGATFSGETIRFVDATFSGERTRFEGATFSGSKTRFMGAAFSGENTDFDGAVFSGGTTADDATVKASFVGSMVRWGPITPRTLPSHAPDTA
jgi:uncharacterized protein YjbI with pentapeptide repeats